MNVNSYIGKILDGRYEVKSVIGKGGSACVFGAEDKLLSRTVALKILEGDKNEFCLNTKSFDTEAKAISMLSHPNIVNVYDISVGGSVKYIVMEHVDGITLRTYLNHRKILPPSEVVSCARQVLRGLREAHNKGIVHRDIKPQNIMIMKNGQIKVADFGIARLPDRDRFMIPDRSIGTVHYISPEQARGNAVDARSDIYSLGIVMYEMATGVRPFESENPSDVAIMQVTDTPTRPCEINPNLPRELEAVIMCALSKKPENRYESAQDMLRVLERMSFVKKTVPTFNAKAAASPFSLFKKKKTTDTDAQQPECTECEELVSKDEPFDESEDTMEIPLATDVAIEREFEKANSQYDFDEVDYDEPTDEPVAEEAPEEEEAPEQEGDATREFSVEDFISLVNKNTEKAQKEDEDSQESELSPTPDYTEEDKVTFEQPQNQEVQKKERPKREKQKKVKKPILQASKKTKLAAIISAGAVVFVALVVAVVLLIVHFTKKFEVPGYVGYNYTTIADTGTFKYVTVLENSSYPEGIVISQTPKEGDVLRRGGTVTLVVSGGPVKRELQLPEGLSVDYVKTELPKLLRESYSINATIKLEYKYHDTLALDTILAYTGTVQDGGVIVVEVSAGKTPEYVTIPDFVGKRLSEAYKFFEENRVAYEIVVSAEETEEWAGTVIAQSAPSGTKVQKYVENGKVTLTVGALSNE